MWFAFESEGVLMRQNGTEDEAEQENAERVECRASYGLPKFASQFLP